MNSYEKFADLSWSLDKNDVIKSYLFEVSKERYLRYLDQLIKKLRVDGCGGIQDKIGEIGDIDRLDHIISELELATALLRPDRTVELLPQDYMRGKSPDLLVSDNTRKVYFEAKVVTDDEGDSQIIGFLRKFLAAYSAIVNVKIKDRIALPEVTFNERYEKEKIIERSLQEFKKDFEEPTPGKSKTIETEGAVFEVIGISSNKGYPGVIKSSFQRVPEDKLRAKIERDLIDKARKRKDWKGKDLTIPYIVALHFKAWTVDDILVNEVLFGHTVALGKDPSTKFEWQTIVGNKETRIPKWKEIERAKERGWEEILIKKSLIPSNWIYLLEPGLYLCCRDMENISGIIARYGSNNIEFIPNPFAASKFEAFEPKIRLHL